MMKLLNNFIILLQNDGGKEMMAMFMGTADYAWKENLCRGTKTSESKGKRNPGRFRNWENWQRKNDETADNK